jgi:hypothetical protein
MVEINQEIDKKMPDFKKGRRAVKARERLDAKRMKKSNFYPNTLSSADIKETAQRIQSRKEEENLSTPTRSS